MKTPTFSLVWVCLLFAATGNAPAQHACTSCRGSVSLAGPPLIVRPAFYFFDPSRQDVNWATAEQIRAMACYQRAIAAQEWIKADQDRWRLNLAKRDQRIRQTYVDGKTLAEAKMEMRQAVVDHRRDLLEKMQAMRELAKQEQSQCSQVRKTDTAYVLDRRNGGAAWTGILAGDRRFAAARETIDGLLRGKSGYLADFSPEERRQIFAAVKDLDQTLKGLVAEVSPQTYCQAKGFLRDLTDQVKYSNRDAAVEMADSRAR
jgi:hypothetical protein